MRLFNAIHDINHNCLVVVRHGQDHNLLTTDLDQPLINETILDINDLSREIATFFRTVGQFQEVELFYSPKLRVKQTANILSAVLAENGIRVNHNIISKIRELHQGSFIIKEEIISGDIYLPLLAAWKSFQEELSLGNLLYRFGDPLLVDGIYKYPQLLGWFTEYGENQLEFSLRLYNFIESLFSTPSNTLRIIVSHQAIMSRIQRLISAVNNLDKSEVLKDGDFVTKIERTGDRLVVDYSQGVVISKVDTEFILSIVRQELNYLRNISS